MAWAQELKNLVAEIKTSHRDRAQFIKDSAKEIKDFLAKSEADRKKDFDVFMKATQARIQELKTDVKEIRKSANRLISGYESERKEAAGHWASLKSKGAVPEAE